MSDLEVAGAIEVRGESVRDKFGKGELEVVPMAHRFADGKTSLGNYCLDSGWRIGNFVAESSLSRYSAHRYHYTCRHLNWSAIERLLLPGQSMDGLALSASSPTDAHSIGRVEYHCRRSIHHDGATGAVGLSSGMGLLDGGRAAFGSHAAGF